MVKSPFSGSPAGGRVGERIGRRPGSASVAGRGERRALAEKSIGRWPERTSGAGEPRLFTAPAPGAAGIH
ncbi:MAG: hypothetical protein GY859_02315 [Desulfobacterales bacterium]|nr:hypothetical protein [Desulfobacterales bacterium]